ncbi:fibulin-2-like [Lampetra fluviatilis]
MGLAPQAFAALWVSQLLIACAAVLPVTSPEELIHSCCAAGQQWAAETGRCGNIPMSGAQGADDCRVVQEQCCMAFLHDVNCQAGVVAARSGGTCTSLANDVCEANLYKQCCDCCSLGMRARIRGHGCGDVLALGHACSRVFRGCCEEAQNLIPPPGEGAGPRRPRQPETATDAQALAGGAGFGETEAGAADDLDECTLYPGQLCQQLCVNTAGSFRCACFPRHRLQADGRSCLPDNEDRGDRLELHQGQNHVDRCQGGGPCSQQCHDTGLAAVCSCFAGHELKEDGHTCQDVNECLVESHTCLPGQRCVNTVGSFLCERNVPCIPGFQMGFDNQCTDVDECLTGSHSCGPSNECQNTQGSFLCRPRNHCGEGFTKDLVGNCADIDECSSGSAPCRPGFNCINTVGSFTCQRTLILCGRGYHASPDGVRCVDVDECSTGVHTCGEDQFCQNAPGTYRCDCRTGYEFDVRTRACVDVNECWKYPGRLCAQTCDNTEGSFQCSCGEGFRLAADGKNCEDIDECSSGLCGQECSNTYGSFQCYCLPGYELSAADHTTCQDVDECSLPEAEGLCAFRCVNTEGSFQCECPDTGYTHSPNGRGCRDVDECALGSHNCSSDQTCYNIQGSFRCLSYDCPPNYRRASDTRCERISCHDYLGCADAPARITHYALTFPDSVRTPANIFRIGPSPAFAGDSILLSIPSGNELGYFATRKLNSHTGVVMLRRPVVGGAHDFLLEAEMKLFRQGTVTSFVAKIFVFITTSPFPTHTTTYFLE